ncbi:hypothetical protein RT761_01408 [Atribacter laminatus]|uniref:HTH cro/C1-type domain-containing protein n=1 Tax=Atribacter laminatus TaxID=2847778 RepID=A0A7T1ALL2_ATRLM|nr:hypothetical protein RT761_01408 [Atribacter laminatus]
MTVLKRKRLARGLKNMDVAVKVGVSETYYSKIENLTTQPNTQVIKRLEKLFATSADELFKIEE